MGSVSLTMAQCAASSEQTAFDVTNSELAIEVRSGSIASNCLRVQPATESQWGYTLTLEGPNSGNLIYEGQAIGSISGTIETPVVFTGNAFSSEWGFAVVARPFAALPGFDYLGIDHGFDPDYPILGPSNLTNNSVYAAVPTVATPIARTETASVPISPFNFDIYFAVSTGLYTPTGLYEGSVTIAAFANAAPPPLFMQELTAANCPLERTMAIDARNNATYWVRKIPGTGAGGTDLCWMETNLAYAGGGDNQFGDVLTLGLTQGIGGVNTAMGQACYGDNGSLDVYGLGCYWVPTGANVTTAPNPPSTSTDGGVTNPQYGYLYNWCAAMGRQSAACQVGTPTVNPNVNICPLGWRLPTGEPTTGEFTLLNNTVNGGLTNSDSGLLTASSLMRSGWFSGGGFGDVGANGYYWSSTALSATNAHALSFNVAGVWSANEVSKGGGLAVRCVAD